MHLSKLFKIIFIIALTSPILYAQFVENHNFDYRNNLSKSFQSEYFNTDSIVTPPLIKDDFIVNSFTGEFGADQKKPRIAIDSSGNYAVTWIDKRNGYEDIYAQFYDANDQPIGSNILVNDFPSLETIYPDISANKKGDFVIAWSQKDGKVLAQKFSKDGIKVNGNFQLNSLSGPFIGPPSIALNESGGFLAIWKHKGSGNHETYSRYFDESGNPLHQEIFIYDSTRIHYNFGEDIAVDGQGNFVVVFIVEWNYEDNILIQRYDNLGQKLGTNIKVNVNTFPAIFSDPAISATDDGHFLIVSGNYGIIYHFDNYFVTDQLTIFQGNSQRDWSTVSSNKEDTFLVQGYNGDPFWGYDDEPLICQMISTSGQLFGNATCLITNSMDSLNRLSPQISNLIGNHFYVTFPQDNIEDSDIHLQKYDLNYNPIGDIKKINNDAGSAYQDRSLAYMNKQGQSIILWRDQRNGRYDLYAQVYDSDYNPVGDNIQINDNPNSVYYKKVSSLSDGTFVVAFSAGQSVYLQRINALGAKIGSNTFVSTTSTIVETEININELDQILVGWYVFSVHINVYPYIRKYDKNLSALSPTIELISQQPDYFNHPFAMSINEQLNIFITWLNATPDTSGYIYRLLGQFYNDEGNEISQLIVIESLNNTFGISSVHNYAVNTKNYIVTWTDQKEIYVKRFYSNGYSTTFSDSFNINFVSYYSDPKIIKFQNNKAFITFPDQEHAYGIYIDDIKRKTCTYQLHQFGTFYQPDISDDISSFIFGNSLLFAYESNKNPNTGFDIWANVQSIDEIDFDKEKYYPPAKKDILYQNFPNPFNNITTIVYELLSNHKVKITVYDILGRKVKTLVDKIQDAGIYYLDFDSSDLASGIYYCKMEGINTPVIKMLIVK